MSRRRGSFSGQERIAGVHPVREALRARRRPFGRLWVRPPPRRPELEEVVALAQAAGVPVAELAELARETDLERSQGVVLEAGPIPELGLDGLLDGPRGERCVVALDGVEDPQNLGALLRVADGAGIGGVLLTERRAPPLSAAVTRASAGAVEHVLVARVPNLSRALERLRREGFWTLGADPEGGEDLFEASPRVFEGDLAVVLGAEGRGLRPGVERFLDHRIRIPMAGHLASLNVATAAAVVLFEVLRRRRARNRPPGSP